MSRRNTKGRRFWESAVDRQRLSGLSVAVFCRKESLRVPTFYLWRKRLRIDGDAAPASERFAELVIEGSAATRPQVEAAWADGTRIVVTQIGSLEQLTRVLAALRAPA